MWVNSVEQRVGVIDNRAVGVIDIWVSTALNRGLVSLTIGPSVSLIDGGQQR